MQIVIPMSGFGERFRRAGYTLPKPLIPIDGKPIISYVIDMFPGETNFLFICNQEHLDHPDYEMRSVLTKYCPTGKVIGIEPHKLGPVHAVLQAKHLIDPAQPVVVNYCDFTCYWDWAHFKNFTTQSNCVGAIPAYRGFHPHSLGSTNYAYMRASNGWVTDIQEKKPFTDNRIEEYASSGTYYFATGEIMDTAFRNIVAKGAQVAGEYYVSLAYKPLLEKNKEIAVYELQHFMQWGTPEDVADYLYWSKLFRELSKPKNSSNCPLGSLLIPMAGAGQRFSQAGYDLAKPLIPVSGQPMVAQAASDLPSPETLAFVLRADMAGYAEISETLKALYPNAILSAIDHLTEGQACTVQLGVVALQNTADSVPVPLTIGTCDNGVIFDEQEFRALVNDPTIDIIVWAIRGYPNALRFPNMYGWLDVVGDRIRGVSVKTPLSDPTRDPIVLGTFTFKQPEILLKIIDRLIQRNGRINGEFYLDSTLIDAIELGLNCQLFEVDSYLSWGTPNDLRTFEYWQSCFHKWANHPYNLQRDSRVSTLSLAGLEEKYKVVLPVLPMSDLSLLGCSRDC